MPWADACVGPTAANADEMAEAVLAWLQDAADSRATLDYAVSALTWCRRLPMLAGVLPARDWWNLLDHLLQTAAGAGAASLGDHSEDAAMIWQLLAGELAFDAGLSFS